ncbi:hypothetical protein MKX73_19200 [Solibacillus sp. FSL W7-1436]|uniref:hypothetical protein n=1 Tax=Solibacillus sp. FSL W7-1436 TaxID=2921705 RepID=UPI0030FA06A0
MNPFTKLTAFANNIFTDVLGLVIAVFSIGILVCAVVVWKGDEQAAEKFKKGLIISVIGLAVAILAKVIISYVRSGLA